MEKEEIAKRESAKLFVLLKQKIASKKNIPLYRKMIIAYGDPEYNFLFARTFEGTKEDILEHQKVIENSGNAQYAYLFARYIGGADILALQEMVIESGDALSASFFAINVKDADRNALEQMILSSNNVIAINLYLEDVKKKEIQKEARIAKANAEKEIKIAEAQADEEGAKVRAEADAKIAEQQNELVHICSPLFDVAFLQQHPRRRVVGDYPVFIIHRSRAYPHCRMPKASQVFHATP